MNGVINGSHTMNGGQTGSNSTDLPDILIHFTDVHIKMEEDEQGEPSLNTSFFTASVPFCRPLVTLHQEVWTTAETLVLIHGVLRFGSDNTWASISEAIMKYNEHASSEM